MTNEEKAKQIADLCKNCIESNGQPCDGCMECESRGYYYGAIDMAKWKDEQFIETAQEDAENYVKGVAKANPDLSVCVLNLLETAYIAGRNRIK